MAHRVRLSNAALREFRKLPKPLQQRLQPAIDELANNPRPSGVVKLQGEDPTWRLRVGDYRIIYEIYDRELLVLVIRVVNRREAYRR